MDFFPMYIFAVVVFCVLFLLTLGRYIGLWFQAFVSGTPISISNIIARISQKK